MSQRAPSHRPGRLKPLLSAGSPTKEAGALTAGGRMMASRAIGTELSHDKNAIVEFTSSNLE